MRILVAGASGLIGSAVAARLRREGHVAQLGRRPGSDFCADLAEPADILNLDISGFDAFVHCAGVVDEDFAAPAKAFRQATTGAAALVEAAAKSGVGRFAYISSAHVYGPMQGAIDESVPADPRSDYAIAHYATEQIVKRAAGRFEATAAFRPCAVFGTPPSYQSFRRWALIPFAFPRSAVEEGEIILKSSGEQRRNFIATADVAEAVARWLQRPPAAPFEVLNPVGATTTSVWQFAQLCASEAETRLGQPVRLERLTPGLRPDPGASFDFHSVHDFCQGSAGLRDHVAEVVAAFHHPFRARRQA